MPISNVLYLDDDDVVGRTTAALGREVERIETVRHGDIPALVGYLDGHADATDCIVSRYDLPRTNGIELFERIRDRVLDHPEFVLFDDSDGGVVGEALDAGVTDVVRAGSSSRVAALRTRIENAVDLARTRRDRAYRDEEPVGWVRSEAYTREWPDGSAPGTLVGPATDITGSDCRQRELEATKATVKRRSTALESFLETVVDPDASFEAQVERILEMGSEYLELDIGIVADIDGQTYTVTHVVGGDGIEPGAQFDLEETYCALVAAADGPVEFHSPEDGGVEAHPAYRNLGLEAYIGAPIYVEGDLHGTINFSSPDRRDEPFGGDADVFVRLFAQWLGRELARRRSKSRAETRRKRLEAQNERLDDFTSVVSHDLRNPLTLANGQLKLAREQRESEHLDGIERALNRIKTLIDDLLQLARQGRQVSETEQIAISELVDPCWRTVETADATLHVETTRTVTADRTRLRQLLENLLRNAVEHGGSGVTVTVGALDGGFYVGDDGSGIPVGDRDDVFASGYTTRDQGTGIGLSIVRDVAHAHGWELAVTESAEGGARFEITGLDGHTNDGPAVTSRA